MVKPKNKELPKELSRIIMIVKMVKLHRDLKYRVLYEVEDIATCLVEYVQFWDDWWEGKENKGVDFYCTYFKLEFVIFQNDATRDGSILSYEVYRGCLGTDGHTMANLEMVTDSEDGGRQVNALIVFGGKFNLST
ncbi:hypothetical protein Tco_0367745 [Tanacetum coccineum]